MNKRIVTHIAWLIGLSTFGQLQAAIVIDFEELPLAPQSYFNGYDVGASNSGFQSQGVLFNTQEFGPGWSYSNVNNTTDPNYTNHFSAFTGTGYGGSGNYAIATGYWDLVANNFNSTPFNPLNVGQLRQLPSIVLPSGSQAVSLQLTNATYPALLIRDGNQFSSPFGGTNGDRPDFFKLSVFGIDGADQALGTSIEFYLADYRFADNTLDYVLDQWQTLDLTPLAGAASLHFNLSSSDVGDFGMNTPGYFAIDNLTLSTVPEPSGLIYCLAVVSLSIIRPPRRPLAFTTQ